VPVLEAFARKVMPRVTRVTDTSRAHHA